MKNLRNPLISSLTIAATSLAIQTASAEDTCTDITIRFVEPGDSTGSVGKEPYRRIEAVIPCDKTPGAPTVLHFFEQSPGKLCVAQRTCGNVRSWQGYFGVTVGWSDLTLLGDFNLIRDSLRLTRDWNGYRVFATFALNGGQIERDCAELSTPTCVTSSK